MKKTLYCSEQRGSKIGYRGYVFNPADWTKIEAPKRLSACEEKYRTSEFGNLTFAELLDMFFQYLPYEIVWHDTIGTFFAEGSGVSYSHIPIEWMNENITGYWRDLYFTDELNVGGSLGVWRSGVRFQLEDDAIYFKLRWIDGN